MVAIAVEKPLVLSLRDDPVLAQVIARLETGALKPAAMIAHSFPAAQSRAAFDLIETHPEQTVKVQLVFGQ